MAQKQAQMTFDSRRHKFAAAEMQPAFKIIRRVEDKLDGRDFPMLDEVLSVDRQVDALINEAQNMENLCQHFAGWCIHW